MSYEPISSHEARFLGLWIGDGSASLSKGRMQVRIAGGEDEVQFCDEMDLPFALNWRPHSQSPKIFTATVPKSYHGRMESLGLALPSRADLKFIPFLPGHEWGIISGLWQSDGTAYRTPRNYLILVFASKSRRLIEDLSEILTREGVKHGIHLQKEKVGVSWKVRIHKESHALFRSKSALIGRKKHAMDPLDAI